MDKMKATREKTIIKTSIIGIIANVFLAGFDVSLAVHPVIF